MDTLIKLRITFEIFLQLLLPPPPPPCHLYNVETWEKILDADVQRCLWGWGEGEGVGQVWIDKKTQKCKCVSGLLSMIAVTGRLQFLLTFEMINRYPNPRVHLNCNLQLFSRKVVGKSARDNPERYCGLFWVHCSSEKERNLKQWH